jgi:hypothetical protein
MRRYDFWLVMITVAVLAAMGLLAFGGTLWTWAASARAPTWAMGPGYAEYTRVMDLLAGPLVAALVAVLGLCIPRRMLSRDSLLLASVGVVLAGLFAGLVEGPTVGMGVFLGLAAALQVVALALTVARVERVTYLGEGLLYQIGSAVLHLGLLVLVFDWAVLPDSPMHLTIFWAGSGMLVAGSAMCFYRAEIAALGRRLGWARDAG